MLFGPRFSRAEKAREHSLMKDSNPEGPHTFLISWAMCFAQRFVSMTSFGCVGDRLGDRVGDFTPRP